ITAGVVAVAAMAFSGRGSEACLSSANVLLSNVRLMPCMAADAISRAVVATHLPAGSTPTGVSASSVGKRHSGRLSLGDEIERVTGPIRDGFMHGAGRVSDELSDSERDARLLRQLGVVLGIVYASFLVAWLWATRLRW